MARFAGRTFVVRIDRASMDDSGTLASDLAFLMARDVRPIVVAPSSDDARAYVRTLNRHTNVAVGLTGADAALLPSVDSRALRVQTRILATLTGAGYLPVIEPTAFAFGRDDVRLDADDVAAAVAAATEATRAIFFTPSGGVVDPQTLAPIAELTPAEALSLADGERLEPELRATVRAAARGVRAGVGAAQILDGRIAHAAIVELLTQRHLGTQVTGTVYLGVA